MLNYKKAPYIELEDYHAPQGIQSYFVPMPDGIKIRLCFWKNENKILPSKGTILLQQGYNEFVEKYFEVITEFIDRGYCVVCFDWRGQGMSGRIIKDKNKAYIKDFSEHDNDLYHIINNIIDSILPKPLIGVGHSMGGCLLLSFLHDHEELFDSLILSAPMLGLKNEKILMLLTSLLKFLNKGTDYMLGTNPNMGNEIPFEINDVTSDKYRYERTQQIIRKDPNLRLWGPTVSWANSAKRRLKIMRKDGWAEKIQTKIIILNSIKDRVVDSEKTEVMSRRLSNCSLVNFDSVEHEIFMEKDIYRKEMWSYIDNFLQS